MVEMAVSRVSITRITVVVNTLSKVIGVDVSTTSAVEVIEMLNLG